ncbi:hypothetical protein CDAR_294041 [Caerostris darwini]|uniref:Uncharacterized protein n=1 Tax=Caerostris darwini TaxID=1538125 RepID=A0AAV4VF68_9ARAC|nr:hypothetical protein CDAR_294041 [Caerostris darwini]
MRSRVSERFDISARRRDARGENKKNATKIKRERRGHLPTLTPRDWQGSRKKRQGYRTTNHLLLATVKLRVSESGEGIPSRVFYLFACDMSRPTESENPFVNSPPPPENISLGSLRFLETRFFSSSLYG